MSSVTQRRSRVKGQTMLSRKPCWLTSPRVKFCQLDPSFLLPTYPPRLHCFMKERRCYKAEGDTMQGGNTGDGEGRSQTRKSVARRHVYVGARGQKKKRACVWNLECVRSSLLMVQKEAVYPELKVTSCYRQRKQWDYVTNNRCRGDVIKTVLSPVTVNVPS